MNQTSDQSRPQVNRLLVGFLAISCFAAGLAIAIFDSMENFWCGSFVRVGALMGAFYYAAPSKGRAAAWANISPWWIVGIAGMLLFIVRRPRVLLPIGIAIFVLGVVIPRFLGPRKS